VSELTVAELTVVSDPAVLVSARGVPGASPSGTRVLGAVSRA